MSIEPVIVGEVGSVAHGLGVATSDRDYHGVYIDGPDALIGLHGERAGIMDRDQAQGVKSEPGDTETTYFGLRKYAEQCAKGNPTYMTLLYTPNLIVADQIGLQANRDMFLSKRLVDRHIGYAESMYRRLTGDLAPRTNRPELIAAHGYDTKAAFHAIRLLMQGYELLMHQSMEMPMRERQRQLLLDVRHGQVFEEDAIQQIQWWTDRIAWAGDNTKLPDHPDYGQINDWLVNVHQARWFTLAL